MKTGYMFGNYERYLNKPPKFLSDVVKALYILNKQNKKFNKSDYINYVQSCQNSDGGFGFYPGTTSFLENTFYALKSLKMLNSKPIKIESCLQFIMLCQSKTGGFGRQVRTVPTIESTYYAVKSLKLLRSIAKV